MLVFGIIGPNKINLQDNKMIDDIRKTAEFLARSKQAIIVTPDKGGISEFFANRFKGFGGERIIGVIPMKDKEFGSDWINKDIPTEIIDCKTWRNQPETLCERSDYLIAFGLGCGTMIEICYAKWFKVKKIFYLSIHGSTMPREIEKDVPIEYIGTVEELLSKLEEIITKDGE